MRSFRIIQKFYLSQIRNLEETLKNINLENNYQLAPLNKILLKLQEEVKAVRSQAENQADQTKVLMGVKMKLEEEIKRYDYLIEKMSME